MSKFKIHNTLGHKKEVFIPIDENHIRIYACGPTVYNYAHIGNARMAVVCDLLVRYMRSLYPKVTYVSNITDIDDKIINTALESNIPINELTSKYEKIYNQNMSALNVLQPDVQPRATEHIKEMIELIDKLIKQNNAYIAEKHVLFDVTSYKNYGVLSGRNKEDQIAGSRVEVANYKKNSGDFILWKPSTDDQPGWKSPWGRGRPGWHIECSAMSEKTLSLPFDIHGGGLDLTFPHHENEIAQSCAAHNFKESKDYAKYWIHNGFVTMDGEKMSKSLGNIFLVDDLLKEYSGETLRLALISTHYRQPLNWNSKIIDQAKKNLDRIYRILKEVEEIPLDIDIPASENIKEALSDDLNSSKALFEINLIADKLSKCKESEKKFLKSSLISSGKILGIIQDSPSSWLKYGSNNDNIDSKMIEELIEKRKIARKEKQYTEADNIRDKLNSMGIEIEDKNDDTIWRSKN
ncbi:MAG: Cysteine--tRNA ligase [Alphaproteobacteria bacterium MarineAlpha9_Bin3]|nr:MAG: Cysteine--tRNA ligase [Alphaproteobacteria bacterium MarineAlpha9_Bin3]|tara:strand:- start:180 stop:1571 length:1392 start_codon:yes stop_codon:yes gene_type:complete